LFFGHIHVIFLHGKSDFPASDTADSRTNKGLAKIIAINDDNKEVGY
jgi:hypothetical protein